MPDSIVAPGDAVATAMPSGLWWLTTLAGVFIPVVVALAPHVPSPWNDVMLQVASALAAALGITHSGKMVIR